MRVAYADPPYPGQALKHYGPTAKEVNHRVLIGTLCREYPDGWLISTSAAALGDVLALCPTGVRVGAWVKTFASFKPGVNPAYAWEPVIFTGGRKRARREPKVLDWLAAPASFGQSVRGSKPLAFWFWLFALVGLQPGDQFDDVFPGSHAGERAWSRFVNQRALVLVS